MKHLSLIKLLCALLIFLTTVVALENNLRSRRFLKTILEGKEVIITDDDPYEYTRYYVTPDAVTKSDGKVYFGICGKPGCCPDGTPAMDYIDRCESHQENNEFHYFTNPSLREANYKDVMYYLDWCSSYDQIENKFEDCGEPAALQFCQEKGYANVKTYEKGHVMVENTEMIASQEINPNGQGDYFYQILCTRSN